MIFQLQRKKDESSPRKGGSRAALEQEAFVKMCMILLL